MVLIYLILIILASADAFSTYLVQWRGEKDYSYSPREFREAEFINSVQACVRQPSPSAHSSSSLTFETVMEESSCQQQNQTNQNEIIQLMSTDIGRLDVVNGAARCATLRNIYEVLGEGDSFETCAAASAADSFTDRERKGASWAVRCRDYRNGRVGKAVNVGKTFERDAIIGISSITDNLRGPVDLSAPEILLYIAIFPGSRYLLLRELGHG